MIFHSKVPPEFRIKNPKCTSGTCVQRFISRAFTQKTENIYFLNRSKQLMARLAEVMQIFIKAPSGGHEFFLGKKHKKYLGNGEIGDQECFE